MPMGIYIIVLIFVFGIVIILNSSIIYERNQLPCEYLDSINITDGIHRPDDDSVVFNGMVFDKNQYARIDYVLDNGMTHRAVPSYVRGCICQMKSCIRLCCPYNSFYQNRSCHRHSNHTHIQRLKTTILNRHKQIELISLDHRFTYVTDRSCHQRYIADEYQMIYTGSILFENKLITHWNYCLNPLPSENGQNEQLQLKALVCLESQQPFTLAIGMMLSVPFIAATALVYIVLAELNNFYGKCMVNHLMSLACAYIILGMHQLNGKYFMRTEFVACVVFFLFIVSFLWVGVISVELYLNFCSSDRMNKSIETKQFLLYVVYVSVFSLILANIVHLIDSYGHGADDLKACFLDYKNTTQCSYFYIPIWIIFAVNQIFFSVTAFKMRRTKQQQRKKAPQIMLNLMPSRELKPNGMNNDESFALYLRLHMVICLTWICKGLALLADEKLVIYSNVMYAALGFIIFVLFVMNRYVLSLVRQRWQLFIDKSNRIGLNRDNTTSNESTVR